jgi:tRNA pseudouridine55 synthase
VAEPNGVLPVDKPVGPTSHDAVAAARRALRTRRIGHTGTLDPFASGLLLLCLGSATRLAEYLTPLPKSYRAVMRLGVTTDTDDLAGEEIGRSDGWAAVGEERIREALQTQVGELLQLPPLYSAKKVGGVRAYAAARRGEEVERTPSRVTVHRIDLVRIDLPEVEFDVECSSGTYIRAIARDVGEALGVGGHLSALRRTGIGDFRVEESLPLEALHDPERVLQALVAPAAAVAHLPSFTVAAEQVPFLRQGRALPAAAELPPDSPVALVSDAAPPELLAIGERRGASIQPRKVFT